MSPSQIHVVMGVLVVLLLVVPFIVAAILGLIGYVLNTEWEQDK